MDIPIKIDTLEKNVLMFIQSSMFLHSSKCIVFISKPLFSGGFGRDKLIFFSIISNSAFNVKSTPGPILFSSQKTVFSLLYFTEIVSDIEAKGHP